MNTFITSCPTVLTALPYISTRFVDEHKRLADFGHYFVAICLPFVFVSFAGNKALFLCVIPKRFR